MLDIARSVRRSLASVKPRLAGLLDERGQDLMEYLVLAAVVAVAVIVGIGLYSGALNTWFTNVAGWIAGGPAPAGPAP